MSEADNDTFRAFVADHDAGVESAVREMTEADLADGDVRIGIEWSSLNYKGRSRLDSRGQGRTTLAADHRG